MVIEKKVRGEWREVPREGVFYGDYVRVLGEGGEVVEEGVVWKEPEVGEDGEWELVLKDVVVLGGGKGEGE